MGVVGYVTMLLSLIAVSIAEQECPPQGPGDLCQCRTKAVGTQVICRNVNEPSSLFYEIQKYRGYKIDVLLLENVQLPYLPAGLFLDISVKEFIIKDSVLNNLYSTTEYIPSPFAGLEDSLEEFAVYSTKDLSTWYYPDLKRLKNLKKIEIVQSPINFVSHVFAEIGEGSVESITVAYSEVYRIHPQAFPELKNLKEVNFRGNFLPYMVRTMFPEPAMQLKKIDLSDNKLFTLPENMFDNMPALDFLDLSQNEFKYFEMSPVYSRLTSFYISKNPFECGCHLLPLKKLLTSLKDTDLEKVTCSRSGSDEKIYLNELSFEDLKCY